jgi:rod shape-determining protein MreC
VLCLLSLALGSEAGWIHSTLRRSVSIAATPFWKIMTVAADTADYAGGFFLEYNEARREAANLRAELAKQTPKLVAYQELKQENERLREMLRFRDREARLALQPVAVRAISTFEGALMIDRGSVHGVREGMCAMVPEGIVGLVMKVEPYYSFVYTLHHGECRIGAVISRTRAHGVVVGSGSEFSHICRMQFIDSDEQVLEGDLVATSGGPVFPPGYPIGRVVSVEGENALLQTAYIEPFADPYSLDEVFLVRRAEVDVESLAGEDEDNALWNSPGGAPLPDERTPQERLAP